MQSPRYKLKTSPKSLEENNGNSPDGVCIFRDQTRNYDKQIRQAFQILHEWVSPFGLNPKELLYIGIPSTDGNNLVTYDCCIEYPLSIKEENPRLSICTLCSGKYAVLTIEKTPSKIRKAIGQFRGDYLYNHQLIWDEACPIYEIYYEDTMEYCVPILG